MELEGYGPYQASFRGGLLDGATRQVISTCPGRVVHHSDPGRARPWDGKPLPARPYDVYEIVGHDVGGDGTCVYEYVRTVR